MELLAQAAARAAPPVRPDLVDESRLCGSPGKIVDAGILDQLLRLSPEQQVFYGPGKSPPLLLSIISTIIGHKYISFQVGTIELETRSVSNM